MPEGYVKTEAERAETAPATTDNRNTPNAALSLICTDMRTCMYVCVLGHRPQTNKLNHSRTSVMPQSEIFTTAVAPVSKRKKKRKHCKINIQKLMRQLRLSVIKSEIWNIMILLRIHIRCAIYSIYTLLRLRSGGRRNAALESSLNSRASAVQRFGKKSKSES